MNTQKSKFVLVLGLLTFSVIVTALTMPAWAQTNTNPSGNPEVKYGVYDVRQTVEFGGKIVDTSGSPSMWSTLVNQQSGGRLLSETFDMHAPTHNGLLFDDLSLNTYGLGDPNNVATVRILKGKWYNFAGNFRRDKTFFDYDLLDNQLIAANGPAAWGYTISPHLSAMTRKSQDYSVTLFPVSRFKVRLGYAYTNQEGFNFSSAHFGTEGQFDRPWRTTNNTYRTGFTFKLFQGTNVSFDHVFSHFKNDTSLYDKGQLFNLDGKPLDLGLQPCATALTNPAICSGFFGFNQFQPVRSDIPTDTFGFTSSYKRLEQTGHVSYSGGEMLVPNYIETYDGLTTRTNLRQYNVNGSVYNKRVEAGADYAATLRLTDHIRLVETFRWDNYRIPTSYFSTTYNYYAANLGSSPVKFDPAICNTKVTTGCPPHLSSSAADIASAQVNDFLAQDIKTNLVSLEFDTNRHFGGHVGFRYDARTIRLGSGSFSTSTYYPGGVKVSQRNAGCVGGAVDASGICTVDSSAPFATEAYEPATKGAVAGIWFRPSQKFRANFDLEALSTDHPFVVISPKNFQFYRIKSMYAPKEWLQFSAAANLLERSNDQEDINNKQHNRSISLDASLEPNRRYGLDLSYSYSDIFSSSDICYYSQSNFLNSSACTALVSANYWAAESFYKNQSHFGSVMFRFAPTERFRASVGYAGTYNGGSALMLNPLMSPGPLDSIYHMPSASFEFDLNKALTWKTAWNYYGYEEGSYQMPGVTLPRDARGNVFTLSLKYKIGQAR